MPYLDRYRRPVAPARYASLPADDDELLEQLRSRKSSDSRWLEDFGLWRGSVLKAETEAEGNLVLLLSVIVYFDIDGDESNAFELRRFIGNEYKVEVPENAPSDLVEARRLARKWSARHDVLSLKVRNEERATFSPSLSSTEHIGSIPLNEYRGRNDD
jgi:hypothetical protein